MLTDNELILLNQRGFIPGPSENEDEFLARVDYCLNLKRDFEEQLKGLPFKAIDMPLEIAEKVNVETNKLFGIVLNWVPIVFSNYKMAWWHGGCAWLFQMTAELPMGAFFQLRSAFKKSPTLLGIYHREEVLAHESAHIGRMKFEEPKFEEVFAYRTAKSSFRQYFGPIVQSPWESLFFVVLFCLCMAGELYMALSDSLNASWQPMLFGLKILLTVLTLYGIFRVARRQRQLKRCLSKLDVLLGDKSKANAVAYRLTDNEIIAFANRSEEGIKQYAEQHQEGSLRWRAIYKNYFARV